jgi:hypothetical protein
MNQQDKYKDNDFPTNLEASQELVRDIASYLKKAGLYVRPEDDTIPFINSRGEMLRLADIQVINSKKLQMFYVEAKDHCRCNYYEVTGQPQRYISNKMKLMNEGKDVFIIFRENLKLIRERAEIRNVSEESIIGKLINDGFARKKSDGTLYFIPYGHRLTYLLKEENMRKDLECKIKSKLDRYYGEIQYLWRISSMLPIDVLIKQEIL